MEYINTPQSILETFYHDGQNPLPVVPVSPRCDVCELSAKGLCPSARKVVTKAKGRKEIIFFDKKETSAGKEGGPEVEIVLEGEDSVSLTT